MISELSCPKEFKKYIDNKVSANEKIYIIKKIGVRCKAWIFETDLFIKYECKLFF